MNARANTRRCFEGTQKERHVCFEDKQNAPELGFGATSFTASTPMTVLLSNTITLFTGLALAAVSASACRDGYHEMCCEANYDLIDPATFCEPTAENPSCTDPYGPSSEVTFFTTCCDTTTSFEQTCSTQDGKQTCDTTISGVCCISGGFPEC